MKSFCLFSVFVLLNLLAGAQPAWQWGYEAGGAGNDLANAISTDRNGYSYVTGRFNASVTFGTQSVSSYAGPDIFIAKYTPSGSCAWLRHAGSIDGQDIYGDEGDGIDIDDAGNCYVTGNFKGQAAFGNITIGTSSSTGRCVFLAKYDSSGNVLWATSPLNSMAANCYARGVTVDSAGNAWITGYLGGSTTTFGAYSLNGPGGFIAKYDAAGNVLFATKLGVNGALDLYGISNDPLGNSFVTGYLQGTETIGAQTFSSTGNRDAVVIKSDAAGNFSWLQQAHSFSGTESIGYGICCDRYGNAYITGKYTNTSIFGQDTLFSPNGSVELLVVKYDNAGNEQWARQTSEIQQAFWGQTIGCAITCDPKWNIYITGDFESDVMFGSQPLMNNNLGMNTFITAYTSTGNCQFTIPSTGQNPGAFGFGISCDHSGGIYIAGYDKAPVVFGGFTTQFLGGEDAFVAKLFNETGVGVQEQNAGAVFSLYENGSTLHLSVPANTFALYENPVLDIYDVSGRRIKEVAVKDAQTDIDQSLLSAGIYCWQLCSKSERLAAGKVFVKD